MASPGDEAGSRGERPSSCWLMGVQNRTEPRTPVQWIRYVAVAAIALFLVWWMMHVYVL